MKQKTIAKCLLFGLGWLMLSAFSFTLADKPGSHELAAAHALYDAGKYPQAEAKLLLASEKALDEETSQRIKQMLAKLALNGFSQNISAAEGLKWLHELEATENPNIWKDLGHAYHWHCQQ
jgi:hypothetical protein